MRSINPTRRQTIAGIAVGFAALAAARFTHAQSQQAAMPAQPSMVEKASTGANKDLTSIHYDIDFTPSPQRLYQAILDQKQFSAFSGSPAAIDPTPGGAFSMFGGLIVGRNIELVPNQRIVQAWRPTHWDPGIYSIVHFEFNAHGAETSLAFDHTGFAAGEYDHLVSGWHSHYWQPLKKFLA